jgi:hypothetical protein
MDMTNGMQPDPEFWLNFLNERAAELGLERVVKMITPPGQIGASTWAYEAKDGHLIDLGWNVEQAEATLRSLVGV